MLYTTTAIWWEVGTNDKCLIFNKGETMKPRELCEKAWQEIAQYFPDFKSMQKGQKLKKISKNKDLTFEIYFKPSRHNYAYSVEFSVYIWIYSTAMKKANIVIV